MARAEGYEFEDYLSRFRDLRPSLTPAGTLALLSDTWLSNEQFGKAFPDGLIATTATSLRVSESRREAAAAPSPRRRTNL